MALGSRALWTGGLLLAASGALVWRAFRAGREDGAEPARAPARVQQSEPQATAPVQGGERTAVLAQPAPAVPAAATPSRDEAETPRPPARSPLAQDIDRVAASFLTEQPRVLELLDLVERTAAAAAVDPDSVSIQRSPEGDLVSARGTLAVGDVRGTFRIDQDSFGVDFTATVADPRWSQRVVHLTFQPGDAGARTCHANVQFHPTPEEAILGALGPDGEKLVGWSVGTSVEGGTLARPLTLHALEGAWTIGASEALEGQEFPWASGMRGFDAWFHLLEPYASGTPR